MRIVATIVCLLLLFTSDSYAQAKRKAKAKKSVYEEVDLEQMIKRYFGKEGGPSNPIEGIYSVSCYITKRSKNLFTGAEKMRLIERSDNYARVAILRDWPGSKRDFIEISMSYHQANKYPIVGEFVWLVEGTGYLYRHTEPDGAVLTFSMLHDLENLLEGEYSKVYKRKTITYRLSYLKIYPKSGEVNVRKTNQ